MFLNEKVIILFLGKKMLKSKKNHIISRAILEVIVSGVACTPNQVEKYASCTLLAVSMSTTVSDSSQITDSAINSCIKFLEDQEFIRLQHLDSGVRYMVC